jgi:hypothetical protein
VHKKHIHIVHYPILCILYESKGRRKRRGKRIRKRNMSKETTRKRNMRKETYRERNIKGREIRGRE